MNHRILRDARYANAAEPQLRIFCADSEGTASPKKNLQSKFLRKVVEQLFVAISASPSFKPNQQEETKAQGEETKIDYKGVLRGIEK